MKERPSPLQAEMETLGKIALFSDIDGNRRKLLAFVSKRVTFFAGDVLMSQGEAGETAYVIIEGRVEVFVETPAGETRIAEIGAGEIVGEIAILCDSTRTTSVRALEDVDALCIPRDTFMDMIEQFPDVARQVLQAVSRRLKRTTEELVAARAGT